MPTPSRQLLSRTIYDTDGSTTDWEFAFSGGYLDQAHVKAQVEEAAGSIVPITVTPLMLTNQFTLRIVPAIAAGKVLTIYRDTPKDLPLVDFTDEAGFTEIALDTNAKQAIFVAAEATDSAGTVSTGDILSAAATVGYVPQGTVSATNVQDAITEIAAEAQPLLVSGTNIKTVNGTSLLGAGNIAIAGGASAAADVTFNGGFSQIAATTVQGALLELDQEKQPLLVSGTHVKTINGSSIVGPGDLVVGGAGAAASVTFTPAGNLGSTNVQGALQELDSEKQPTLVSGTTIKTINGSSLLGAGNIVLGGGSVDRAAIQTALTSSPTRVDWIWNTDIPGAANAGDNPNIYIQRNAQYTGGPTGGVNGALYIQTFTPTGQHESYEWGLTSALHSRSIRNGGAPQNVAINGTAFRDAGNAPIWAGNFPAYHLAGTYNGQASGEMHGVEISVGGNGFDPGEASIGAYILPQLRAEVAGPGTFEAWTGILVANGDGGNAGNGYIGPATFRNGITNQAGTVFGYFDRGTHQVGIDLSASTNTEAAIRIKANEPIAFEGTNAITLRYNSSNGRLEFKSGATGRGYINMISGVDADLASGGGGASGVTLDTTQTITGFKTFTGGIDVNGMLVQNGLAFGPTGTAQWNINMTTLTAGSGFGNLPANPAGFVKILVEGQERKVPFYV